METTLASSATINSNNSTGHTHHLADSSGSNCYNCHMPHTAYGLLKAIRNHTISSPDLKRELTVDRPNACNQCHLDKTLKWTAEHLRDWYSIDAPELDAEQSEVAASILWLLKGKRGQPSVGGLDDGLVGCPSRVRKRLAIDLSRSVVE